MRRDVCAGGCRTKKFHRRREGKKVSLFRSVCGEKMRAAMRSAKMIRRVYGGENKSR